MTNQEYSRLLAITYNVVKSNDSEFVKDLLHTALARYEERTDSERKAQLEKDNLKISYIARIICNEFSQFHRKKKHTVCIDEIDVVEDEDVFQFKGVDVELMILQLEQSDKRGYYLANLFRVYLECNCKIKPISAKTKINRQTIKNDIDTVKEYLKTKIWQEVENQED